MALEHSALLYLSAIQPHGNQPTVGKTLFGTMIVVNQHKGGQSTGIAHCRSTPLVMQVKTHYRAVLIANLFQQPAFRCHQAQCIPVDINSLGVEPLIGLGAVRIQHRDHQQRVFFKYGPHRLLLGI